MPGLGHDRFHRRSIRLRGYDYRTPGPYFVTICSANASYVLSRVDGDTVTPVKLGHAIEACWQDLPNHHHNVLLDEFIIMPNHVHGIIILTAKGTAGRAPTKEEFGRPVPGSLPTIVRSFKSACTKKVNETYQAPGLTLWQRGYYEHIVRDEEDLRAVRNYIRLNPQEWNENPASRVH